MMSIRNGSGMKRAVNQPLNAPKLPPLKRDRQQAQQVAATQEYRLADLLERARLVGCDCSSISKCLQCACEKLGKCS
jgi:hypothetical protein